MSSVITHILFDLGNVVIKINFDKCFHQWAKASGGTASELKKLFIFDEAYKRHEKNEISGMEYYKHVCTILKMSISYDEFLLGWNSIFEESISETVEFIREASGSLNLSVLTNSNLLHREKYLNLYESELKLFKNVFCSSQIKLRKPDAETFLYILNELKISEGQLVFVDDLFENIEGARALGIKSVYFQDPKQAVAELRNLLGMKL